MRRLVMLVWVLVTFGPWSSTQEHLDRAKVIESVESNLLSLFGFARRPRPDKNKVVIPQAMLDLYKKQTGMDLDTASIVKPGIHAKSANTVRSFTHVESPIDGRFPGHHRFRLYFDVTSVPKGEKLKAAELSVRREAISALMDTEAREHLQQVLVHDIVRPGRRGKYEPMVRLVDSKLADTRHAGTLSLDVLPAVQRWLAQPASNHGLLVQVVSLAGNGSRPARHLRLRRAAHDSAADWAAHQPLLFTYTDDGKNAQHSESLVQRRAKRSSAKRNRKKEGNSLCRRHQLYVDFQDVGWNDWIVAPPGYDAYYCRGDCPFPLSDHLNTTNHAIVQTLVNSVKPSAVPKPCCVPTLLNSISMLYVDEESKVVLKNYQDMAVIGCGCR